MRHITFDITYAEYIALLFIMPLRHYCIVYAMARGHTIHVMTLIHMLIAVSFYT